jgi:hypothetical protein
VWATMGKHYIRAARVRGKPEMKKYINDADRCFSSTLFCVFSRKSRRLTDTFFTQDTSKFCREILLTWLYRVRKDFFLQVICFRGYFKVNRVGCCFRGGTEEKNKQDDGHTP